MTDIEQPTRALENNPEDVDALTRRGDAYQYLEQYDNALADYAEVIRLDSNNGSVWFQRGSIYADLKQWDKAAADFSKAIELEPDNHHRWSGRANTYFQMERWDEAIADLTKAIELEPGNSYYWYHLALAELGSGNVKRYRSTCVTMLSLFEGTDDPTSTHWMAWTCVLAPDAVEDFDRVVELAEFTVEKGGKTDQNRNTLGAILYRAGRLEDAVEKLTELTNTWDQTEQLSTPISPAYTWFLLAMAHQQLGNSDEAKIWFDKAVQRSQEELQGAPSWNRQLTLQLFRQEAAQLLSVPQ